MDSIYNESNCGVPSMLNTSSTKDGVNSQLASIVDKDVRPFDGVTIENMRNNPIYSRHDDIDVVGLVQNRLTADAKTVYSKRQQIRTFNEHIQKMNIPSKNFKR